MIKLLFGIFLLGVSFNSFAYTNAQCQQQGYTVYTNAQCYAMDPGQQWDSYLCQCANPSLNN